MGALGLVMLAAGAVIYFAVDATVSGVNLAALGVILMVIGALGVVAGLATGSFARFGYRARTTRSVSPDGRTVVEEQRVA